MKKIFKKCKSKFFYLLKNEDGMGVVEVVLIVLVLVGLALLFKNEINAIAKGIFDSIKGQVKRF